MVLGIKLFRNEEGIKILKESQRRRFASIEIIDEIVKLDKQLRDLRYQNMNIRTEIKKNQREISEQMRKDKNNDISVLLNKKQELEKELEIVIQTETTVEDTLNTQLNNIGNLVHDLVPVYNDEKDNLTIKTYAIDNQISLTNNQLKTIFPHNILLEKIGGYDQVRGAKVVGHRGYFLTNIGVRLNMALQQYAINFLTNKNYNLLQPPFLMNDSMMKRTAELLDYQDTLYRIVDTSTKTNKEDKQEKITEKEEKEDKYLIATSEQPICAYHTGETIYRKNLPIKYGGISTCFRKEAGAHGKDVTGIFRIHQFEKIEQVVICEPEKSAEMQDEMMKICEEFYQSLEIPYQVILIVSGALNLAATKKYDLEAWFPSSNNYRELVSCSNCTDYQSRKLDIKIDKDTYVHMLNATLCATERTICAILENYQTNDGIIVPKVLQRYLNDQTFIPFI